MIARRIGNDFIIEWRVFVNGKPHILEGRNLELHISKGRQFNKIMPYTVSGNCITTIFFGKDQRVLGEYCLTLYENRGEEGMHTLDACEAFELVSCDADVAPVCCMSSIKAESVDVRTYSIGEKGEPGKDGKDGKDGNPGKDGKDGNPGKDGKDGKSAYAIAVEGGYEGTEQELARALERVANIPEIIVINTTKLALGTKDYGKELYDIVLAKKNTGQPLMATPSNTVTSQRILTVRFVSATSEVAIVVEDIPKTEDNGITYMERLVFYKIASDGTISKSSYTGTVGGPSIEIAQTPGDSEDKVMSQKSVTDILNEKANAQGVYPNLVAGSTNGKPFVAGQSAIFEGGNGYVPTWESYRIDRIYSNSNFASSGAVGQITSITTTPYAPRTPYKLIAPSSLTPDSLAELPVGSMTYGFDLISGYFLLQEEPTANVIATSQGYIVDYSTAGEVVLFFRVPEGCTGVCVREVLTNEADNDIDIYRTYDAIAEYLDMRQGSGEVFWSFANDGVWGIYVRLTGSTGGVFTVDFFNSYYSERPATKRDINITSDFPYGLISMVDGATGEMYRDVWTPTQSIIWHEAKIYEEGDEMQGYIPNPARTLSVRKLDSPRIVTYNSPRITELPYNAVYDSAINYYNGNELSNVVIDVTANGAGVMYVEPSFIDHGGEIVLDGQTQFLCNLFYGDVHFIYDEGYSTIVPLTVETVGEKIIVHGYDHDAFDINLDFENGKIFVG